MKDRDRDRAAQLSETLATYVADGRPLAGVIDDTARDVLVRQLIDSLHRVEFPRRLLGRPQSPHRADPANIALFDPLRAAVYHAHRGNHDEACWLVFLFVAYGKGKSTGWRLVRDVYGRLGQGGLWDWPTALARSVELNAWVSAHSSALSPPGTSRLFGPHRQYESVPNSGRTLETYIHWIGAAGHQAKFAAAATGDARQTFDRLYHDMDAVFRFGRLAKFDYLTMLGKLDLAAIAPGSTYLSQATGPLQGARLLFGGAFMTAYAAPWLDAQLAVLDGQLCVGMQVLEDALCNWQKNPTRYEPFTG